MWIKRIGVVFALGAVLVFSATAFAALQEFKDLAIEVPDGWTGHQDGDTVAVIANDKSASLSITLGKTEGKDAKTLAKEFAQALKGSEPVFEDDVYTFTFKGESQVESKAIISTDDGQYMLLVMTGTHPELEDVINSMTMK